MNNRLIAAALAALLVLPVAAMGVSKLTVEGVEYTQEEYPDGKSGKGSNNDPEGPDTWTWDGKNDVTFSGFKGYRVDTNGEATITFEGENVMGEFVPYYDWEAGDHQHVDPVTIVGKPDSSLSVGYMWSRNTDLTIQDMNITGIDYDDEDPMFLLRNDSYASITIDNSTISCTGAYAYIDCQGDLTIQNGSVVDLEGYRWGGINAYPSWNLEEETHYASIRITDSWVRTVIDESYGFEHEPIPTLFAGTSHMYTVPGSTAEIFIENSYVEASGPHGAMAAYTTVGDGNYDGHIRGKITIIDSEIVAPEGARPVAFDALLWEKGGDGRSGTAYGQAIGFADVTSIEDALEDGTMPKSTLIKAPKTITYDPAGGTFRGSTSPTSIPSYLFDTVDVAEAPVREGYTFLYWQGSEYQPGDAYKVTDDHTFTAVWEKNPEPEPTPEPAPEPTPEPAPTPAPATVLPKTADATLIAEGSIAASGALLALAGLIRRKRLA